MGSCQSFCCPVPLLCLLGVVNPPKAALLLLAVTGTPAGLSQPCRELCYTAQARCCQPVGPLVVT